MHGSCCTATSTFGRRSALQAAPRHALVLATNRSKPAGLLLADVTAPTIRVMDRPGVPGAKVLVLNALRKEKHVSHFNLEEALALIDRFKPERAYLTHISHQLGLHADIDR